MRVTSLASDCTRARHRVVARRGVPRDAEPRGRPRCPPVIRRALTPDVYSLRRVRAAAPPRAGRGERRCSTPIARSAPCPFPSASTCGPGSWSTRSRTWTRPRARSIRCGFPTTSSTTATGSPRAGPCWPTPWPATPTSSAATRCCATAFATRRTWPRWSPPPRRSRAGASILGIGAGWNEEEYRAYGWPFPPTRVRIAQLAEAIQLIRLMWTESPASFHGEHYQIAGAYCEPRPRPDPARSGRRLRREVPPARRGPARRLVELQLPGRRGLHAEAGGAQAPLPRRGAGLRRDHPGDPRRHPHRRVGARDRAPQGERPTCAPWPTSTWWERRRR